MIRFIKCYEECREFVCDFYDDAHFSDPMLLSQEQLRVHLVNAMEKPEMHCVFGVFRNDIMTGLFSFSVLQKENYMEMLVGLSRKQEAYEEMLLYLEQKYPSYEVDFVFNPENYLLKALLESKQAEFEPEQQKMVLHTPVLDFDTTQIELLSEEYTQQYCAIHNKDMYWTGEKVAEAQDRFRTFLAIHHGKVVGYLDASCTFDENEIYDLLVLEQHRCSGYGRKLLAKALKMNQPNGMMLLVDVDNIPAINLYKSVGFVRMQGQNSIVAHWKVPNTTEGNNPNPFLFYDTYDLRDHEIFLRLNRTCQAQPQKKWLPAYYFDICLLGGEKIGYCDLRIGHNEKTYIGGNIGYGIDEPYRGNHYAAKACKLLFNLAKKHRMEYLIITCVPENLASAKTCHAAGGEFIERIPIPEGNEMYAEGKREVLVYRFDLKG